MTLKELITKLNEALAEEAKSSDKVDVVVGFEGSEELAELVSIEREDDTIIINVAPSD